jgi:hypothetical protein
MIKNCNYLWQVAGMLNFLTAHFEDICLEKHQVESNLIICSIMRN